MIQFANFRVTLSVFAILSLGACTFAAPVAPSSVPAAEVAPNRRVAAPAYYSISPDIQNWQKNVRPMGLAGSAHTWQINLGTPVSETLRRTLDATFTSATPGTAPSSSAAAFNFKFDLEEADARIMFIPGFFSAVSRADVQMAIRVRVTDQSGVEVARAIVQGSNSNSLDGQVETMSVALSGAAEKAVRNLATDFVYKVINTGVLQAAATPPVAPARR